MEPSTLAIAHVNEPAGSATSAFVATAVNGPPGSGSRSPTPQHWTPPSLLRTPHVELNPVLIAENPTPGGTSVAPNSSLPQQTASPEPTRRAQAWSFDATRSVAPMSGGLVVKLERSPQQ